VLSAAGEFETTQENIQDWLELDGDPAFQFIFLFKERPYSDIFYFFHQHYITHSWS
jgi:hypothetical protein